MLSNNVSKKEPERPPHITKIAMSGYLTEREIEFTDYALNELCKVDWAKPLISKVEKNGGIKNIANIPLLFEVRYAYEIHRRDIQAQYEYKTSVGDSTVDFRCTGKHEWFIELVSILPSDAGKKAICKFNQPGKNLPDDIEAYEQTFDSSAINSKMSENGEILLAEQKIGEKVFTNGQPIKFPIPSNAFHVIVVDMRGMFGIGGVNSQDRDDYLEIAYGAKWLAQLGLPSHRWPPNGGKPIVGLFEQDNLLQSTKYVQERIHFVDFVCEELYEDDEIIKQTVWAANPFLFPKDEAIKVRSSHPLFHIHAHPTKDY